MVDVNDVVLKVDILDGKSTEFGDSHPCVEQDVKGFVVLAVHIIVPTELEELPHLVFGDCLTGNGVIHHHSGKFKAEGALHKDIIVHRHLKCRAKNTSYRLHSTVV